MKLLKYQILALLLLGYGIESRFVGSKFSIFNHLLNCTIQIVTDLTHPKSQFLMDMLEELDSNPVVLDHIGPSLSKPSRYLKDAFNLTTNLTNSVFSVFHPKFEQCIVSLLPIGWISGPTVAHLSGIMLGMIASKENPHFILLEVADRYMRPTNTVPYPYLSFSFTSIILTFNLNSPNTFAIMCTPCIMNNIVPLKDSEITSRKSITDAWTKHNRNLRRRRISSDKAYITSRIRNCGMKTNNLFTPEVRCTMSVLSTKYNYSDPKAFKLNIFPPFNNFWKEQATRKNNQFLVARSITEHDMPIHGITFNPFEFVVFTPRSRLSFSSLISPIDAWTWVMSFINGTLFFSFIILSKNVSSMSLFSVWIFSTICEQVDERLTRRVYPTMWKVAPVVGGWLITCFFIGSVYKGSLFTCLTATIAPHVPTSLKALLESDIVILTTTASPSINDTTISSLKSVIIPDLLNGVDESDPFYKFLMDVLRKTAYLEGSEFEIARNISSKTFIIRNDPMFSGAFAVLDSKLDVSNFISAMKQHTDFLTVKNHNMNPFITRVPWLGIRNSFFPEFCRGLAQLVQSGIYYRWEKHWNLRAFVRELKRSGEVTHISNNTMKSVRSKQALGGQYGRFIISQNKPITLSEANPVSYATMEMVFLLYLILTAVCILSAICEWMVVLCFPLVKKYRISRNSKVNKTLVIRFKYP
jgi:hypothetical protein